MNIPASPEEISPEWLTTVLRERKVISTATVSSIDVKPMLGKGLSSQLVRIKVSYVDHNAEAPTSIIAKFSTADPEARGIYRMARNYEREVRFYDEIADTIALPTPKCYYSQFVEESADHILLLEDLSPAQPGDVFEGCSVELAQEIIRDIAVFHAQWWEDSTLKEKDWLVFPQMPEIANAVYGQYVQGFLDRVGEYLPDEIVEITNTLKTQAGAVVRYLDNPGYTIIHHDFHLDNLMLDLDGQTNKFAVLDWQFVQLGRGIFDIAWFLSSSVKTEDRRSNEMHFLRMYHDLLVENGVNNYSFDEMLVDYKLTLIYSFAQFAAAIGSGLFDDKLDLVRETTMQRIISAVLDNQCGEQLLRFQ